MFKGTVLGFVYAHKMYLLIIYFDIWIFHDESINWCKAIYLWSLIIYRPHLQLTVIPFKYNSTLKNCLCKHSVFKTLANPDYKMQDRPRKSLVYLGCSWSTPLFNYHKRCPKPSSCNAEFPKGSLCNNHCSCFSGFHWFHRTNVTILKLLSY